MNSLDRNSQCKKFSSATEDQLVSRSGLSLSARKRVLQIREKTQVQHIQFSLKAISRYLQDIQFGHKNLKEQLQSINNTQNRLMQKKNIQRLNRFTRLLSIVHKFTVDERLIDILTDFDSKEANINLQISSNNFNNTDLNVQQISRQHQKSSKLLPQSILTKRQPLVEITNQQIQLNVVCKQSRPEFNLDNKQNQQVRHINEKSLKNIVYNNENTFSGTGTFCDFVKGANRETCRHFYERKEVGISCNLNQEMKNSIIYQSAHYSFQDERTEKTEIQVSDHEDNPLQNQNYLGIKENQQSIKKGQISNLGSQFQKQQDFSKIMGLAVKSLNLSIHVLNLTSFEVSLSNPSKIIQEQIISQHGQSCNKILAGIENTCKNHFNHSSTIQKQQSFQKNKNISTNSKHYSYSHISLSLTNHKKQRQKMFQQLTNLKKEVQCYCLDTQNDKERFKGIAGDMQLDRVKRKLFAEETKKEKKGMLKVKQKIAKLEDIYKQVKNIFKQQESMFAPFLKKT